jgi:hypothetical protein
VNPTLIVEETQQPTQEDTSKEIPEEVQEQLNQDVETLKDMQLENTEPTPKVNGKASNPTPAVEPDESQTTISYHQAEGTVEYVSAWPEWYTEEQLEVVGTSIQPPPVKKEKIQIPRSPRKKPTT